MEVSEYSKIVLERIQIMEPQNATRIIGYLLLNFTHQEIKEFAFGSDDLILLLINEAKDYLASSPKPIIPNPIHGLSRSFSSPSSFRLPAPNYPPFNSVDTLPSYMEEQLHATNPLGLDFSSNCSYPNSQLGGGGLFEFQNKPCHYFFKGHCRNGNGCKFLHADSFSQMCNMNPNEFLNDDHIFSRSSLERLEVEISELLKASKGMPVSIASLPSLYLDMYGKTLQADGYLTESQRHGKAGFSLTKLLGRLNSIRLIDRPHGQHAVVLAEDAPKYDYRNDRYEQGALHASSHQIYLTFPAESSFTDKDVLNYFRQYGPVRDVRIPRQEKRMFGFVSFQSPDSVKIILSKSHPHFICGSRVLVKPYKEKTRKYTERAEFPYYPPYFTEMDLDLHTLPRVYDTTLLEKQLMEEQQYALQLRRKEEQQWELELERRCLQLQLSPRPLSSNPYLNYGMEEFKAPADHFSPLPLVHDNGSSRDDYTEQTAKLFSPLPLVQGNGSSTDDNTEQTAKIFNEQDCGHIELPDSPFASLA